MNYFEKYKETKLTIVKLLEEFEKRKIYIEKGSKEEINTIDLSDISYISELFNINNIITKEDLINLYKTIKNETELDLDYKEEYIKLLYAYTLLYEKYIVISVPLEKLNFVGSKNNIDRARVGYIKNLKFTKDDIDEKGNYLICSLTLNNKVDQNDIWKTLNFSNVFIPKSELKLKQEELLNKINEYNIKR